MVKKRDSMLAKEPYLSTIIATAKQYNIHPFLLLAIAGQEQSLVPNSNKKAAIVNMLRILNGISEWKLFLSKCLS
jgi:hypothetical protein